MTGLFAFPFQHLQAMFRRYSIVPHQGSHQIKSFFKRGKHVRSEFKIKRNHPGLRPPLLKKEGKLRCPTSTFKFLLLRSNLVLPVLNSDFVCFATLAMTLLRTLKRLRPLSPIFQ